MIIHLFKDRRDPTWKEFSGIDETGKFRGEEPLRAWRVIFGGPVHRGMHPDRSKVPTEVAAWEGVYSAAIYWLETP